MALTDIKQITGIAPLKYIEVDTTLQINSTTGNDSTGDGVTIPFATIQGCIDFLSKCIISNTSTVTVTINNGIINLSPETRFTHPNGNRIKLNLMNESSPITINGASYASPTITFSTSSNHGLTTGDYVKIVNVIPTNYNQFGVVVSTPSLTQFTVNVSAGLTMPAYIGGGQVTKQDTVFQFNNTNGFIVDGSIGELNIAVSQTGTLSGEAKYGILVGGLKEVVSNTNYFNGKSSVNKGKLYSIGFDIGIRFINSFGSSLTLISSKNNLSNLGLVDSYIRQSYIIINLPNSVWDGGDLVYSKISNSTVYGSNCRYGIIMSSSNFESNDFVFNNNTNRGVLLYRSTFAGNTIAESFNGNGSDFDLYQFSIAYLNGLTAINHTSNVGFQTFFTFASDMRIGCNIQS